MSSERWLQLLLRALGAFDLLALGAVVMPNSWMAAVHAWLGMGDMPQATVVEYLARSASLMYAQHATIVLFISRDVRRYLSLIAFMAWLAMFSGIIMLAIDLSSGIPLFWTLVEGPGYIAIALAVLALRRRLRSA